MENLRKLATRNNSSLSLGSGPLSCRRQMFFFSFALNATVVPTSLVFAPLFYHPVRSLAVVCVDVSWRSGLTADEHDFLWCESQLVLVLLSRESRRADSRSDLTAGTGLGDTGL